MIRRIFSTAEGGDGESLHLDREERSEVWGGSSRRQRAGTESRYTWTEGRGVRCGEDLSTAEGGDGESLHLDRGERGEVWDGDGYRNRSRSGDIHRLQMVGIYSSLRDC